MGAGGWDDDSGYADAVQRAVVAERVGWASIAAATGLLGFVLAAAVVVVLGALVGMAYVLSAAGWVLSGEIRRSPLTACGRSGVAGRCPWRRAGRIRLMRQILCPA
ncbi:hypothetical protein [Kitasatospora sp. NPDC047058]|uniref:hypothetical protein n=1 Tax=Kitasatospora sp. NPDC047058 TaxID=3155620 RepID=UPI0033F42C9D